MNIVFLIYNDILWMDKSGLPIITNWHFSQVSSIPMFRFMVFVHPQLRAAFGFPNGFPNGFLGLTGTNPSGFPSYSSCPKGCILWMDEIRSHLGNSGMI